VTAPAAVDKRSARRQLILDALGMTMSAAAFGLVYGVAARTAGFSLVEALAMSLIVLAGASQFAAVGLVAQGVALPAIILLTALLNARHLLYSAALVPYLQGRRWWERAAAAHVLTDETFGLAIAHFRRLGGPDLTGYWIGAAFVCLPWIVATVVGVVFAGAIPDPARFGLDIVFPAAMAGLLVGLIAGRPELAAALAGGLITVVVALATQPAVGIVAGGLIGPAVGLVVRRLRRPPANGAA
jgi:4-azaleucine resistance transporter AzlC